jgi:hypothetical protein
VKRCGSLLMPAALAVLTGCGGVTRTGVDAHTVSPGAHYRTEHGRRISVVVGQVTAAADLDPQLRDAVARYMKDQATTALAQHDVFQVIDPRSRTPDLLAQAMQTAAGPVSALAADADCWVHVRRVAERSGATVKVGPLSSQSKLAEANVEVEIKFRSGQRLYRAQHAGQSAKGAWGVVAQVDRNQMKNGSGVWELDGSMAGTACVLALQECVRDLARQVHRDTRRLTPDAIDRLLQPKAVAPLRR